MHPDYTLNGFEYDNTDPNSSVVVKALKAYLRPNLPHLAPIIRDCLQDALHHELTGEKDGKFHQALT